MAISDARTPGPRRHLLRLHWNFTRLYARPLTTFKPGAGQGRHRARPGPGRLARQAQRRTARPGRTSSRTGIKYEDGTPITSKDVKYGIERSNFTRDVLSNGPKYFKQYLDARRVHRARTRTRTWTGLKAIETPDDQTIVFKLKAAVRGLRLPGRVPADGPGAAGQGQRREYQAARRLHRPVQVREHTTGKAPRPGPQRRSGRRRPTRSARQLAGQDRGKFKVNADDIDQRLLNGQTDVDLGGTGVQAQAQAKVLKDPKQKATPTTRTTGFMRYAALTQVKPFDNVDCRKAVLYAADQGSSRPPRRPDAGGDIATTMLPPAVAGYEKADPYGSVAGQQRRPRQGQGGAEGLRPAERLHHHIAARSDRPTEVAAAEALQQSLKKVGIKASIKQFPSGDSTSPASPASRLVHANGLGMIMTAGVPTGRRLRLPAADRRRPRDQAVGGNNNLWSSTTRRSTPLLDKAHRRRRTRPQRNGIWTPGRPEGHGRRRAPAVRLREDLLYRPATLTNVFVTPAYGQYDYLQLGTTK